VHYLKNLHCKWKATLPTRNDFKPLPWQPMAPHSMLCLSTHACKAGRNLWLIRSQSQVSHNVSEWHSQTNSCISKCLHLLQGPLTEHHLCVPDFWFRFCTKICIQEKWQVSIILPFLRALYRPTNLKSLWKTGAALQTQNGSLLVIVESINPT
jgi:hypothetical protein